MCLITNFEKTDVSPDPNISKSESQINDSFKLNPLAKEFVPSFNHIKKKKSCYTQENPAKNYRKIIAQKEDTIKRTIYVTDIDREVTEAELALQFLDYGNVVDCRIATNPYSSCFQFGFIEFSDEESANSALKLWSGTVKIAPSRTGIVAVNPSLLPKCKDEYDKCFKTIYCTNIDKKIIDKENVIRRFFEGSCGAIRGMRVVNDCMAFVEFKEAESAIGALKLSGSVLGSMPIRVSPSKTPLRPLILPPIS